MRNISNAMMRSCRKWLKQQCIENYSIFMSEDRVFGCYKCKGNKKACSGSIQ